MCLPVLARPATSKQTSPRPEGVTFLGGLALILGAILLIAGISFALPFPERWDHGPALIGFWIMLSFGYLGFGQFLPPLFVPIIGIPMIVILATLYFAAADRVLFRTSMGMDPRHNVGIIWSSVEHSPGHHLGSIRFLWYTWADCNSNDTGLSHQSSRSKLLFQTALERFARLSLAVLGEIGFQSLRGRDLPQNRFCWNALHSCCD